MRKINEGDLNLIDQMNGSGALNYQGIPPLTKGAGSPYIVGNQAYVELDSNFNDIIHQSKLFIFQKKNEIVSNITEFWDYQNLPIDKYSFENKLLNNGQLAMYRIGEMIIFSPFTVIDYDIYERPTKIKIVEAKESILNDKIINNFAVIRSDISTQSIWNRILRYVNIMEKILFFLEDNLTSSKPKGLLITNGMEISTPNNNDKEEAMESIVNSENTFFEINIGRLENMDNLNSDGKTFWIPLELADRTEQLIQNYNFFNEKLKELFGLGVNILGNKKERLITDEMNQQQKVSNANIMHMFNIRKTDLEIANQLLGTNITISKNQELWETGEPEKEGENDDNTKN